MLIYVPVNLSCLSFRLFSVSVSLDTETLILKHDDETKYSPLHLIADIILILVKVSFPIYVLKHKISVVFMNLDICSWH